MDVGKEMKISLCVAIHNRNYDFKKVLPSWIDAANASPPVEIVVLDYNSPDDLAEYMHKMYVYPRREGVELIHHKYTGREYFHMAHARNLAVLATTGEFFVMLSCDCPMAVDFVQYLRDIIKTHNNFWVTVRKNEGVIGLYRQDFVNAGGYDERFEFYGPEDKDISARFYRRGMHPVTISIRYIGIILTPNEEKEKNYRLQITKREMGKLMSPIYFKNKEDGVLVANEGKAWGEWI